MRPPLVYGGAIGIGLVLHAAWPLALPATGPLGSIIVLVAVVLFLSSVRAMRGAGTPVPGDRPTTAIPR